MNGYEEMADSAQFHWLLLFSCYVVSNSLQPHGLQHTRLVCPSLLPGVCSKVKVKVAQSIRLFVTPWTLQPMEFSRPEHWSGQPFPSPGDKTHPGIKPRSPTLRADSLPVEPQGKPKTTGAGSLPCLKGIFLTQELNWGLLNCRWILYQLSFQGSFSINIVPGS